MIITRIELNKNVVLVRKHTRDFGDIACWYLVYHGRTIAILTRRKNPYHPKVINGQQFPLEYWLGFMDNKRTIAATTRKELIDTILPGVVN